MADIAEQLSRVVCRHPVTVPADSTIMAAMAAMGCPDPASAKDEPDLKQHVQASATCVVVLEQNNVLGLLTAREMVGFAAQQRPLAQLTVSEVLTQTITLKESELTGFPALLNFFEQHQISYLPTLDDQDQLTGLISHQSLMTGLKSWLDEQPVAMEQDANGQMQELIESPTSEIETPQKIEQELIRKQNYLEALLNNIPHITWMKDEKSRFIAVNQPFAQASDTTPDALVGKTDFDIYPADIAQAYRKDEREVLKSNQRKIIEEKFVRADGTVSWIETTKTPFRDTDGNIAGTVGIAADITERRRIEAALAESEAKFRRLVEGGQDITWSTDTQGRFTYLSPQFKALSGWETSDWIGRQCSEAVYLSDRAWVLEAHTALARESASGALEFRLNHREEPCIWVRLNSTPILNAVGEVMGQQGTLTDIHACKTAELALQESQMQFHRMTENVPGMIFRYVLHSDGADELTYVSSQSREVCEVEPEMALKNAASLWERIHPDDVACLNDSIRASAETLAPLSSIYRLLLPKKGLRWVQTMSSPEQLNNGDVVWDGIVVDITERKQQEQERERLLKIIESTSDYIGFASAEGYILWHNQAFKKFRPDLGNPADRIHLSVGHPARAYEMIQNEALPKAIEQGTWSGESMILDAEGHEVPVSQVLIAHKSDEGEVEYFSTIIRDISDRKAIERQLEFTQYGLDHAADCFYCLDEDANIKQVNQATCQHTGYTKAELLSMTIHELTPTCPKDKTWKPHWEKLKRLKSYSFESVQKTKSGKIFPVEVVCNYLEFDGKSYDFELIRDITNRKAVERALRDSQERIQRMTENVPGMIYRYVLHPDGNEEYTYVSSKVRELYECEPETALNNFAQLKQRVHPDDLPVLREKALISAQKLQPYHAECRLILPKKGLRWMQLISIPERLANGDVVWDGIVIDITERKVTESSLQQSEEKFRTLVSNLHGAVYRSQHDAAWTINYMSDAITDLSGYPASDFVENAVRTYASIIHPDDAKYVAQAVAQAIAQQESFVLEYRILHRDESIRWVYEKGKALFDQEAQFQYFEGVIFDISDLKQAEVELKHTNEELIRATRLKDEFLANMSHELRTPLNSILGWCEALQEKILGPLEEQQIQAVRTIEKSGNHLLRLINDILDVAKIESGKIELSEETTDVSCILNSSIIFIKPQLTKKNIQLSVNVPNGLPSLLIDEQRIIQVLINLLDNAIKFTPNNGEITIEANYQQKLDWGGGNTFSNCRVDNARNSMGEDFKGGIKISISDTGIGIAPENLSKLFQPFTQIDGALNRQYEGTGLGLALVKKIAELHGGMVTVRSKLGAGSCFSLILPCDPSRQKVSLNLNSKETPQGQKRFSSEPSQSPLILLAEDNESNVQVIVNYLEFHSYRLIIAENGIEAIDLARAQVPDLILMDIQMPQMNGIEAIKSIRKDSKMKDVPIIALTALAMKGDEERCLSVGAHAYLSKPVKLKHLHQLIRRLIDPSLNTDMPSI